MKKAAGIAVMAIGVILTLQISIGFFFFDGIADIFKGIFTFHPFKLIGGLIELCLSPLSAYGLIWLTLNLRSHITGTPPVDLNHKLNTVRLRLAGRHT
ncbi:MAG TPA: hypothetical protein VG992_03880 [Candidatus Saccharimonadales bacterium]|nr:hypothetical protein [Candidatus Saccharimonadales bacterium]